MREGERDEGRQDGRLCVRGGFYLQFFLIGWFDLCSCNTLTLILGGGVEQVGGQDVEAA